MSNELAERQAAQNTDREIWREREGDYYADSIHVTAQGSIGINCGGTVIVKPVREWHKEAIAALRSEPVAWEPHLLNRADGRNGHYCIARYNPSGYYEFLNKGKWCSAGEVIIPPDHRKTIIRPAAPSREDQRESSEGRIAGSRSLGSNPAPDVRQSKTGLTESHSGAPTQDADELLREAKQHEGRGDDCGRLARLVISYLSRRQG